MCSVVQVWPDDMCHTQYKHYHCEKPKKCPNENAKHLGDNFEAIARQSLLRRSSKLETEYLHQDSP